MKQITRLILLQFVIIGCLTMPLLALAQNMEPFQHPTDAQIQKGRDLVTKIARVLLTTPLSDEVAVMKAFGYQHLGFKDYPDHRVVYFKQKPGDILSPQDAMSEGLLSLSLQPWVKSQNDKTVASLSGNLDTATTCITLANAINRFGGTAKDVSTTRIVSTHPIVSSFVNDIGYLHFSDIPIAFSAKAGIYFDFKYKF